MKKKLPLVSIIIPAYRAEYFISDVIKSLSQTKYPNFEVIIVFDPFSDQGPSVAKKMVSRKKRWQVIENRKHIGLTNSLNKGIRKSKGEYIAVIATDMAVDPSWLRELMKYLANADESIGAAVAKIYDFHQRDRIQVYRMFLMPQTGYVYIPEYGFKDRARFQKLFEGYSGSEAIVFRRSVFKKAGMFDPDVTILIYDLDMIWRTWLAGFKVIRVPTSKVYHWSLKEGRASAKWEFLYAKMISLFIQNYSLKSLIIYLPQLFTVYTIRALIVLLRGNPNPMKGWLAGIYWSIQNLPKTLRKRKRIQNQVRAVSDDYLMDKIFSKLSLWAFYKHLKKTQKNITPVMMTEEGKNKEVLTFSN